MILYHVKKYSQMNDNHEIISIRYDVRRSLLRSPFCVRALVTHETKNDVSSQEAHDNTILRVQPVTSFFKENKTFDL